MRLFGGLCESITLLSCCLAEPQQEGQKAEPHGNSGTAGLQGLTGAEGKSSCGCAHGKQLQAKCRSAVYENKNKNNAVDICLFSVNVHL